MHCFSSAFVGPDFFPDIFSAIRVPLSFPLHVMAPPFKCSSCRLLSVKGSAAGDRSQPSQGQEGHPLWQFFSKELVVDRAYTMELAACSEPNSGPKTETCESEHRRFEGGFSFDMPCSLSFTHRGDQFPLQQLVPQAHHILAQPGE